MNTLKKITAAASAVLIAGAALPAYSEHTLYATEYFAVDELAAIEFDSFEKLEEYYSLVKNGSEKPYDDQKDFFKSADGIYLPDGVSKEDITSVLITPTYCAVYFKYNDKEMHLDAYYDKAAGKKEYDFAKYCGSADSSKYGLDYSAKTLKSNGNTVYYYRVAEENKYAYKQDGVYFELAVSGKKSSGELSLCNSKKQSFGESAGGGISTPEQLMNMSSDGDYYLTADIDLTGVDWKPIEEFSGTLDGGMHEIKNLHSNKGGLFLTLGSGAEIKDVMLTGVYINSWNLCEGAVAGVIPESSKNVRIENCFVNGVVSSCRSNAVSSTSTAGSIVGGVGSSSAVITSCCSAAVVAAEGTVGGIAGENRGKITKCGFNGQTGCSKNIYDLACDENGEKEDIYMYLYACGGIAGRNSGTISDSFSNCTRLEVAEYYGGIAGRLEDKGKILRCVNSSDVLSDDEMTGGLIAGYCDKTASIKNCYTKKPDKNTVKSDVGKGRTDTVTYSVKESRYGKISSFKRLGKGWSIINGRPSLPVLNSYVTIPPEYEIVGERLNVYEPDEDDFLLD